MRTPTKLVVLLLALALALSACGRGVPAGAAATVNGSTIDQDLLERLVRAQVNAPNSPLAGLEGAERADRIAQLQRQVLTSLIQTELIVQAATDLGLTASEEEIDSAFEEQEALQGSPEQLAQRLAEAGYRTEDARDVLRSVVLQNKLQEQLAGDVEVPEEQLRQLYEQRKAQQYELADVSHILVETQDEAQAIVDLLEGGASFEELARSRSIDTQSGAAGGELGRHPRGYYVPAFDEAVWDAEEGELVGPIETEFGWHVLRVNEFISVSFEEAREDLRNEVQGQLVRQRYTDYLNQWLAEADVEVNARFGRFDLASGTVVDADPLTGDDAPTPAPTTGQG